MYTNLYTSRIPGGDGACAGCVSPSSTNLSARTTLFFAPRGNRSAPVTLTPFWITKSMPMTQSFWFSIRACVAYRHASYEAQFSTSRLAPYARPGGVRPHFVIGWKVRVVRPVFDRHTLSRHRRLLALYLYIDRPTERAMGRSSAAALGAALFPRRPVVEPRCAPGESLVGVHGPSLRLRTPVRARCVLGHHLRLQFKIRRSSGILLARLPSLNCSTMTLLAVKIGCCFSRLASRRHLGVQLAAVGRPRVSSMSLVIQRFSRCWLGVIRSSLYARARLYGAAPRGMASFGLWHGCEFRAGGLLHDEP